MKPTKQVEIRAFSVSLHSHCPPPMLKKLTVDLGCLIAKTPEIRLRDSMIRCFNENLLPPPISKLSCSPDDDAEHNFSIHSAEYLQTIMDLYTFKLTGNTWWHDRPTNTLPAVAIIGSLKVPQFFSRMYQYVSNRFVFTHVSSI